jgi:hypothetical protein
VDFTPNSAAPGTVQHSYYTYTAGGVLSSVSIQDGRSRSVTLTNDAMGQALRRDEADGNAWNPSTYNGGDPHEAWYRFNGRQMGSTGNNGTYDNSYAGSLSDRTHTIWGGPGAFRYGATLGMSNVEFNDRLTPINTYSQGGAGGSYTVRNGDSLSTIAAQLWGDSSLWYLLAQANGLGGDGGLVAGQTLAIPGGVQRNTNNANTFKAYDPAQAFGDTSPTTPQPQKAKKSGCGGFGQLLVMAISIAVTVALPGSGIVAGAINGMIGSAVGQGVGLATGIQDKFNFGAVAMAGIAGGIGGALQGVNVAGTGSAFAKVASDAARGMISSALTQGVGVATGLQSKFDFAGVAVAGLVGGVGGAAARGLASTGGVLGIHAGLQSAGGAFLSGTASGIAGAAARSMLEGTDFGDNLLAVLPDVIGTTIGRMAANSFTKSGNPFHTDKARSAAAQNIYKSFAGGDPTSPEAIAAVERLRDAQRTGNTGDVQAALVDVIDAAAATSPQAKALAESFYSEMASAPQAGDIVVKGYDRNLDWNVIPLVDRAGVWTGQKATEIEQYGQAFLEQNPRINAALNVASLTLTVAGGPVKYVAGKVFDSFKDEIRSAVATGYSNAGWEADSSALGGKGVVLAGGILLTGLGALKGAGGIGSRPAAAERKLLDTPKGLCFASGTLVHTRDGLKAIDLLRAGDVVWSRSEYDVGDSSWRKVTEAGCTGEHEIYEVVVSAETGQSETCRTTELHPFWIERGTAEEGCFIAARSLPVGAQLRLADGSAAYVMSVSATGVTEAVYNFSVEGWHTYYVGELGVWVHNECLDGLFARVSSSGMPRAEFDRLAGGWSKGTYDSVADSIIDHAGRHGYADDVAKYMRVGGDIQAQVGARARGWTAGPARPFNQGSAGEYSVRTWSGPNNRFAIIDDSGLLRSWGIN